MVSVDPEALARLKFGRVAADFRADGDRDVDPEELRRRADILGKAANIFLDLGMIDAAEVCVGLGQRIMDVVEHLDAADPEGAAKRAAECSGWGSAL